MEEQKKRRTTTSSAVKRKYNNEHYALFQSWIDKELHAQLGEYIAAKGWSKAEFLKTAFEKIKEGE